ncbi:cysteine--tRNA ligase [Candidatus Micrarchaeota archaeon]|nr:cysteine--tRNA ligase [Candidatus Micrarchaeota archaeon]
MIHFFNTLTRHKDEFKPIQTGFVRIYSCGPTVYNYPHIGNYRAYCFADLMRRFLEWKGLKTLHVMNITDVDDKTIRDSQKEGVSLKEFCHRYETAFHQDLAQLNVLPAHYYPRATEHINDMLTIIQELIAHKKAYKSDDGSVYFKIDAFPDYGKLSGLKKDALQAGASGRVKKDEYTKDNASDFVLWKAYDEADGDVFWETRVGKGRPGWHIECSGMSTRYLGYSFDIHTGGVDLIFPHHENEIAQSEGASKKKFVNYWLHNEHLLVDGKKMSKSLGNFYTLRDLLDRGNDKGFDPLAIRYALIATHYRSQLNFTFDVVHAAEKTLAGMQDFLVRLDDDAVGKVATGHKFAEDALGLQLDKTKTEFAAAMSDDLDVATALASIFALQHAANKALDQKAVSKALAEKIAAFFWHDFNAVFGVLKKNSAAEVPETVLKLVEERERARKEKDFKKSDSLRDQIKALGFALDDTGNGVRVKKI